MIVDGGAIIAKDGENQAQKEIALKVERRTVNLMVNDDRYGTSRWYPNRSSGKPKMRVLFVPARTGFVDPML